jgi:hypothetical protein
MLGLQLDASKRELQFAPHLPADWDSLSVRHIHIGGAEVSLALSTTPERVQLEIENSGPALTLDFRPPLPSGMHVSAVHTSAGDRVEVNDQIHMLCPTGRTQIRLHLAASR